MQKRLLIATWMAAFAIGAANAASGAETPSAAATEPLTVLLLPARAHVVKLGMKLQPSEEWTAASSATLDVAVRELVDQSTLLNGRELPSITPQERAAIDEFLAVTTLIQMQFYGEGNTAVTKALRKYIDHSLGPSLSFLRERTGTDYALVTLGIQAEQSSELVALGTAGAVASVLLPPLLVLPPASLSHAALFLIELSTGDVHWFNGRSGYEFIGYNFTDLRDPASAHKVIAELLQPYPEIPPKFVEKTVPKRAPKVPTAEPVSPGAGEFAFDPPAGWRIGTDSRKNIVTATRDGRRLNEIKVQLYRHSHAFPETAQRSTRDSPPGQLAQQYVAELQSMKLDDLQISESTVGGQLAGRPAFRTHFSFRLSPEWGGARVEQVTIGAAVPHGLLLAELSAPQLYYFAEALPAFEESTRTVVLEPRGSTRFSQGRP